jgi:hypothetical protein
VVTDGGREPGKHRGIDDRIVGVGVGVLRCLCGRVVQRRHGTTQALRQDPLQLGQRAGPAVGVADAGEPGTQADGDGYGLLVVEQQRREVRAATEPVVPGAAGLGLDRVAQCAQADDVGADGADRDAESLRELGAGPAWARLQKRQQREQAGGGVQQPRSRCTG